MIDVKELRVGNVIKCDYDGIILVDVESMCDVKQISNEFSPIKLTEEILIKCGFEKIDHIHGYSFYSLSKSKINKCHLDVYENNTKFMGYAICKIKYLHQLQNLVYALTGKELVINI